MTLETPVAALIAAIAQFPTQAAFHRALNDKSKIKLTKPAVSQWLRRGRGCPASSAPDVERISGVPAEKLRPDVSWDVLRQNSEPPVYVPRYPPPVPA